MAGELKRSSTTATAVLSSLQGSATKQAKERRRLARKKRNDERTALSSTETTNTAALEEKTAEFLERHAVASEEASAGASTIQGAEPNAAVQKTAVTQQSVKVQEEEKSNDSWVDEAADKASATSDVHDKVVAQLIPATSSAAEPITSIILGAASFVLTIASLRRKEIKINKVLTSPVFWRDFGCFLLSAAAFVTFFTPAAALVPALSIASSAWSGFINGFKFIGSYITKSIQKWWADKNIADLEEKVESTKAEIAKIETSISQQKTAITNIQDAIKQEKNEPSRNEKIEKLKALKLNLRQTHRILTAQTLNLASLEKQKSESEKYSKHLGEKIEIIKSEAVERGIDFFGSGLFLTGAVLSLTALGAVVGIPLMICAGVILLRHKIFELGDYLADKISEAGSRIKEKASSLWSRFTNIFSRKPGPKKTAEPTAKINAAASPPSAVPQTAATTTATVAKQLEPAGGTIATQPENKAPIVAPQTTPPAAPTPKPIPTPAPKAQKDDEEEEPPTEEGPRSA
ncbi:MAG: hypothetical protein M1561_00365 [Gammaproteobacteria bacterium]|nr:hypothetical protein [Gammaproteobacteria bacterium]